MPTYARAELAFTRGEGVWLETATGDRYLDFASGVATAAVGHAHPHLVQALETQARTLWHVSNLFTIPGQDRLAARLTAACFADRVFFCNSGAEAMEAALKLARRWHWAQGRPERWRCVTFAGAFHGRTLATLAAGNNPKHLEGFGPVVDGFDQVPWEDAPALEAALTPETAAIVIEPVQGEGGIRPASADWLRHLRAVCDQHGLLLVFDEVQSGMGRTGHLFAHQPSGITPDILATAKGLGAGFPLGACLATEAVGATLTAGSHGTTLGGNPLAMAVGHALLDVLLAPGFLDQVQARGASLRSALETRVSPEGALRGVHGAGLMLGLEVAAPNVEVVAALRAEKLLSVPAGRNQVRLLPPLVVENAHLDHALAALDRVLAGGTS